MRKTKKKNPEADLRGRLRVHFKGDPSRNPGGEQRVDFYETPNLRLAIEEPLGEPDRSSTLYGVVVPEEHQERRLALDGQGLPLQVRYRERLVQKTEGANGAFLRELLRKAALIAAEDSASGSIVVKDRHVDEPLAEPVVAGGAVPQSLWGAKVGMSLKQGG